MIIEINIPLMVSFSVLIILSHVSVYKPKVFCYRMLAYRREKLGRLGVLRPKTDLASVFLSPNSLKIGLVFCLYVNS